MVAVWFEADDTGGAGTLAGGGVIAGTALGGAIVAVWAGGGAKIGSERAVAGPMLAGRVMTGTFPRLSPIFATAGVATDVTTRSSSGELRSRATLLRSRV